MIWTYMFFCSIAKGVFHFYVLIPFSNKKRQTKAESHVILHQRNQPWDEATWVATQIADDAVQHLKPHLWVPGHETWLHVCCVLCVVCSLGMLGLPWQHGSIPKMYIQYRGNKEEHNNNHFPLGVGYSFPPQVAPRHIGPPALCEPRSEVVGSGMIHYSCLQFLIVFFSQFLMFKLFFPGVQIQKVDIYPLQKTQQVSTVLVGRIMKHQHHIAT